MHSALWHKIGLRFLEAETMSRPKRILLIDDDVDHLSLCKLILQRNSYEVAILSDHTLLMETLLTFNPDLIFVDHNMRDITGNEITKMIKSNSSSKRIPVVYFSSCDDIEIRAKEAGADGYISKPFEFPSLLDISKKYLGKNF